MRLLFGALLLILSLSGLAKCLPITATAKTGAGRSATKAQISPGNHLLMRRSLCNTFGGCGAKRSLASSGMDEFVESGRFQAPAIPADPYGAQVASIRVDHYPTNSVLVEEIFDELARILRENHQALEMGTEKRRSGFHVEKALQNPDYSLEQQFDGIRGSLEVDRPGPISEPDYQTFGKVYSLG